MSRWLIAFSGAWGICVAGVFVAWLIGLSVNCLFAPGCMSHLTFHGLVSAVNLKDVLVRGTLLAIVFVGIAWLKRRA
ncbi:hypothetical protein P3T17_005506 [Paraburkholderia sp. GAS82]